ncbi:hypothetical protein [Edaphocola flava]|uniref:hypothetical protein n=1 Tax=Edaphocola flava TaxID=2499629 RepID=UPI00100A91E1|nr:hypothetical protein [Edaphocola flava]
MSSKIKEREKKESIAICLNCYKIRFYEKNTKKEKDISAVYGTSKLEDIMPIFIKKIDTQDVFKNKSEDRILYLNKTLNLKDNTYIGIIMKGHNGPQTLIDEIAGSKVTTVNTVSKDQFHCLPYLFLLYINKKRPDSIIFIAQSYRQYGFKEIFEDCFTKFTNLQSTNTTVKFASLSIASLFEKQIQEGFIRSLRFVKHGLSKNVEGIIKGDNTIAEDYQMELKIKSTKGFSFIKKSLKYDDASFIEQIQIDDFDYNDAYADVIIGGRKRVMNVTKPSDFAAAYDITDDVAIDSNTKLPNFDDIMKQALDILNNDLIPYL